VVSENKYNFGSENMRRRIIVGAIIQNDEGEVLLLKMSSTQGVFPGQWGLAGGGMDEGETMVEALKREVREETSLEIVNIEPFRFADDMQEKLMSDGSRQGMYMIYLVFYAKAVSGEFVLNEEWSEGVWVKPKEVGGYDLNLPTRETFREKGWVEG
jgi:nucleoside triphosphatase